MTLGDGLVAAQRRWNELGASPGAVCL